MVVTVSAENIIYKLLLSGKEEKTGEAESVLAAKLKYRED